MAEDALIQLRGVTKVYGEGPTAFQALKGVDLDIRRGDFVAVMGPSGSGKSTTMNILGCLDVPSAGTFLFKALPEVSGSQVHGSAPPVEQVGEFSVDGEQAVHLVERAVEHGCESGGARPLGAEEHHRVRPVHEVAPAASTQERSRCMHSMLAE